MCVNFFSIFVQLVVNVHAKLGFSFVELAKHFVKKLPNINDQKNLKISRHLAAKTGQKKPLFVFAKEMVCFFGFCSIACSPLVATLRKLSSV